MLDFDVAENLSVWDFNFGNPVLGWGEKYEEERKPVVFHRFITVKGNKLKESKNLEDLLGGT